MGTTISAKGHRQVATLNCKMSNVWETKPRTILQILLDSNGTGIGHEG